VEGSGLDDDGFRDFVTARLPALSRVAFLLTGNHHAAEDLLQTVLIKVAAKWSLVAATGHPDAYVRRILYHEHISAWRRNRHLRSEFSVDQIPDAHAGRDEANDAVRRILLERALAKLSRRQRAVLILRYFEDLSEADAAQALGCSVGTVKSQTHHALGRLRALAPELAALVSDAEGVTV
jgi:RNA polymerase sigma-70 factor (sigma-E family)